MSYEKRKKRRSLRKKLRILLIVFILLYLFFRSTPIIFTSNLKTTLAKVDKLKEEFQGEGIVVKDEEVFVFDGAGTIDKKIEEGERVPVGFNVANVNFLKDISGLKQELKNVENSIRILNSGETLDKDLQEDDVKDREEFISEIQNQINKGNFKDIIASDNKPESNLEDLNKFLQDEELVKNTLDSLEAKKIDLQKKINENNIAYRTDSSGIISYEIDGYENIYLIEDFENYTYEKLEDLRKVETEKNLNGFKIIDNFNWYLILQIENKENIEQYQDNGIMNINFMEHREIIPGKIVNINKTGDSAVVVLQFKDYFQDYYNIRFSKINILNSVIDGFKIPKKTVIEKDNQKGVYIKDFNGIVKFRPIIILGEKEDYFFIDMGKSGMIDIPNEENSVKTIGLYDEIFLKPNKIKEGQIIN